MLCDDTLLDNESTLECEVAQGPLIVMAIAAVPTTAFLLVYSNHSKASQPGDWNVMFKQRYEYTIAAQIHFVHMGNRMY